MKCRTAPAAMVLGATLLLTVASWQAHGAPPPPVDRQPTWGSLAAPQQAALAPLHRDWATLDVAGKERWLAVAARFPKLSDGERKLIQARMQEWARLTPAERGRARLRFHETRQIGADDRQARWEAYKALPEAERRALALRGAPRAPAPALPPSVVAEGGKRNLVGTRVREVPLKSVAPVVVQAKPGASTTLMSTRTPLPNHQQPGLPKIAATEGFVDPQTLLPRRGPQAAAVQAATAEP